MKKEIIYRPFYNAYEEYDSAIDCRKSEVSFMEENSSFTLFKDMYYGYMSDEEYDELIGDTYSNITDDFIYKYRNNTIDLSAGLYKMAGIDAPAAWFLKAVLEELGKVKDEKNILEQSDKMDFCEYVIHFKIKSFSTADKGFQYETEITFLEEF